jgi:hypothetical protein
MKDALEQGWFPAIRDSVILRLFSRGMREQTRETMAAQETSNFYNRETGRKYGPASAFT